MINLNELSDDDAEAAIAIAYYNVSGTHLTNDVKRKMLAQFRRLNLHIMEVNKS